MGIKVSRGRVQCYANCYINTVWDCCIKVTYSNFFVIGRHINVLRNHLRSCDVKLYEAIIAEDDANALKRQQMKVVKALQSSNKRSRLRNRGLLKNIPNAVKYNVDNPHQIVLDNTIAVFIAASNCPYSIIRNEDFKTMLTFDPHYRFPGCSRLMSFVNDAIAVMKLGIQQDMASARKINFCWSKKGLSSSYLGLTAHFYCPAKQSIKHVTLAVRVLPYSHTGLSACISDIRLQYRQKCNIPFSCCFKPYFRTYPQIANFQCVVRMQM